MANDLAAMKARIADEIARDDLGDQIALAISTAIGIYQQERFRFSDTQPLTPPTFNTVANQWIYGAAANANISSMFKIDYVLAQIGGELQPLTYMSPAEIRVFNQLGTMHGQPMWWSYEGDSLLIGPTPDAAYPMTLGIFRSVPAPADDATADNPWMTTAELLIRSRAKYELALHVTRNEKMQLAMSPVAPPDGDVTGHATYWAWRDLKGQTNRVTGVRRVRSMQF